jgi:hypothetical protein
MTTTDSQAVLSVSPDVLLNQPHGDGAVVGVSLAGANHFPDPI